MFKRNRAIIILDVLLAARLPRTPSQLMYDVRLSWKDTKETLKLAVNRDLIEYRGALIDVTSESRSYRRHNLNWDEFYIHNIPSKRGRHWFKTTVKGEEYIRKWEDIYKTSGIKGQFDFDYVPRYIGVNALRPPLNTSRRTRHGFDDEWVMKPSNAILFVNSQEKSGDVYVNIDERGRELQKLAKESYKTRREQTYQKLGITLPENDARIDNNIQRVSQIVGENDDKRRFGVPAEGLSNSFLYHIPKEDDDEA